jgi:hypothetical protein
VVLFFAIFFMAYLLRLGVFHTWGGVSREKRGGWGGAVVACGLAERY